MKAITIDPRLRSKVGNSDVFQQTWVEAWKDREGLEKLDAEGRKRRLRRMYINNLLDEIDKLKRRDGHLQKPLDESSNRIREFLAADEATPSEKLRELERKEVLLAALAKLPEKEREVLIDRDIHEMKLADIAERMQCTVGHVSRLHTQGLAQLHDLLPPDMME